MKLKIVESFTDKTLTEAIWYKASVGGNDYYAKLSNSKLHPVADLQDWIENRPVEYTNFKHELLNKEVLTSFQADLDKYGRPAHWTIGAPPSLAAAILTPMSRDERGLGDTYLDPTIKVLAHTNHEDTGKFFVHHLDEVEHNLGANNLVAIPYEVGRVTLGDARVAHKILHNVGRGMAQAPHYSKAIPYYVIDAAGAPQRYEITIDIH